MSSIKGHSTKEWDTEVSAKNINGGDWDVTRQRVTVYPAESVFLSTFLPLAPKSPPTFTQFLLDNVPIVKGQESRMYKPLVSASLPTLYLRVRRFLAGIHFARLHLSVADVPRVIRCVNWGATVSCFSKIRGDE